MARRLSRDDIISTHKQCLLQSWNGLWFNQWDTQESEETRPVNKVDVENFMRKQPNKQIRKYRGRSNSYTAPFARFEYQIDTMDMKPLAKEPEFEVPIKNGEPRYGLVVSDIFSKLANVVPMKEKTGPITCQQWKRVLTKWIFQCPFIVIMTAPSKQG